MSDHSSLGSGKPLLLAIALILVVYIGLAILGVPQKGTQLITDIRHDAHLSEADEFELHGRKGEIDPKTEHSEAREGDDEAEAGHHAEVIAHPPYWMITPFALLLGAIAVLPLVPATEHWWESNLNRFIVAAVLAAVTLLYYLLLFEGSMHAHWPAHHVVGYNEFGWNSILTFEVFANAIFSEYIPFIMLLFSLYVISGGIRIEGDLPAHPLTNCAFIATGGLLASFIGTTGAAMLLIRPLLETNAERKHVKHTVIFFIFVVCNCGGCLLPIGDPPLFLGYLRGVDFLWTLKLWPEWLFVNTMLLVIYFVWDHFFSYPKETVQDLAKDEFRTRRLRFSGAWLNVPLLVGVILSVALFDPSKAFPGTDWHAWFYLREIVQLALVGVSLAVGGNVVRKANKFNYHAILEVAALFFGIFICMQAPLQILGVKGPSLGLSNPMQFFWLTGGLSSALDNAPTYVVFFETAKTLGGEPSVAGVAEPLLIAISLGAVFMGAMTYIGNGPNFMVKAIAEKSGIRMPSFFGYMIYSCCILLPLLVVMTVIFF